MDDYLGMPDVSARRALEPFYKTDVRVAPQLAAYRIGRGVTHGSALPTMFYRPFPSLVPREKNVAIAVLLALLFGPLGMFYSTVAGALVMMFAGGLFTVVTLGAGVVLVIPICMLWAGSSAALHNQARLGRPAFARWPILHS
jgi:hypothetical protein